MPAVVLTTYAFRETSFLGVGPGPTTAQFRDLLTDGTFWSLTRRTVVVGVTVGLLVTAMSFVMAYGIRFRFSRRAGRRIMALVIAAGIASFLVRIFAWATILNSDGLLNRALQVMGITDRPVELLFYSPVAVVVTMAYVYLPIGLATVFGAVQDVDAHCVEAGRDLGAGRWRTALQVVAPQVRTARLSSFVLVTVLASADYVTPQLVGGTTGVTIGVAIRNRALSGGDLPGAAAMTLGFLAVLGAVVVGGLLLIRGLGRLARPLSASGNRLSTRVSALTPRGLSRVSFSRPATVLLCCYTVLPTVVVLVFSFNSARTLGLPWQAITTSWYCDMLSRPGFSAALRSSLAIAVVSAAVSTVVGGAMAAVAARSDRRLRRLVQTAGAVPFVVPGILIGLGLMVVADATPISPGYLMTVTAHIVLLVPVVVAVLLNRLIGLNPEYTQAARDLGAGPAHAFRTITLPLVLPSVLAALVIGFTISMDEVFVTVFTIGSDSTLPIWMLSQARVGFDPGLNALGVMLVTGTVVLPVVLFGVGRLAIRALRRDHADVRATGAAR